MQIHQLKPSHKRKKKRRVGRGGKRGAFSGRGQKGQKARAGRKMKPSIREIIKKYPKLRGYKFKKFFSGSAIVNLETLEKDFDSKETVNPQILLEKGLIRRIKGKMPKVKILGNGEIKKALIIENCAVSKQAKEKVEKAGGEIRQ